MREWATTHHVIAQVVVSYICVDLTYLVVKQAIFQEADGPYSA
jgi:hypothetical protein